MNTMIYKGYEAIVGYDEDANLYHGEVMNTRDVSTFQGRSVEELTTTFVKSVEDYFAFRQERGEEPESLGITAEARSLADNRGPW
jgi:predicted HicB family RNase H-like nuclease